MGLQQQQTDDTTKSTSSRDLQPDTIEQVKYDKAGANPDKVKPTDKVEVSRHTLAICLQALQMGQWSIVNEPINEITKALRGGKTGVGS